MRPLWKVLLIFSCLTRRRTTKIVRFALRFLRVRLILLCKGDFMKLPITFGLLISSAIFGAELIEFHIEKGTKNGAWNTKEKTVEVRVGDTLRIINDDDVKHQLHTNGTPCPHGTNMPPGASYDCKIATSFEPGNSPLYDHHYGSTAQFWVRAVSTFNEYDSDDLGE